MLPEFGVAEHEYAAVYRCAPEQPETDPDPEPDIEVVNVYEFGEKVAVSVVFEVNENGPHNPVPEQPDADPDPVHPVNELPAAGVAVHAPIDVL